MKPVKLQSMAMAMPGISKMNDVTTAVTIVASLVLFTPVLL
jgi:hypothetical protein